MVCPFTPCPNISLEMCAVPHLPIISPDVCAPFSSFLLK